MSLQSLQGARLLEAYDRAGAQPEVLRPLALLAVASPGVSWQTLAEMPLHERNAQLLQLRRLSFGSSLDLFASCVECGERMEFCVEIDGLLAALEAPRLSNVSENGIAMRPLNTMDLAASLEAPDLQSARETLLLRCVDSARWQSADEAQRERVLLALERLNETAELRCDVACPACKLVRAIDLDIAAIVWHEVRVAAKRLLREIGHLARAYGWTEPDVLALSPRRRAAYLEMTA